MLHLFYTCFSIIIIICLTVKLWWHDYNYIYNLNISCCLHLQIYLTFYVKKIEPASFLSVELHLHRWLGDSWFAPHPGAGYQSPPLPLAVCMALIHLLCSLKHSTTIFMLFWVAKGNTPPVVCKHLREIKDLILALFL